MEVEKNENIPVTADKKSVNFTGNFNISVNRNQEKNPILKFITKVPWSFSNSIQTDFMIGKGVGIYFLRLPPF